MTYEELKPEIEQARMLVKELRGKLRQELPETRRERERAWEQEEPWGQDSRQAHALVRARDIVQNIERALANLLRNRRAMQPGRPTRQKQALQQRWQQSLTLALKEAKVLENLLTRQYLKRSVEHTLTCNLIALLRDLPH